jgi:muramidase (phage lysozyme)
MSFKALIFSQLRLEAAPLQKKWKNLYFWIITYWAHFFFLQRAGIAQILTRHLSQLWASLIIINDKETQNKWKLALLRKYKTQ